MSRATCVVTTLLLLALAGCAPTAEPTSGTATVPQSRIQVDTPTLRTMKQRAGVADCVPGQGRNELPPITLPCLGGGPDVDLSTLRGPLVVNLWASWCAPCRKELPIYAEFSEKYAGRVAVLGVDFTDQQSEAAMKLVADSGVTYPQLADPNGDLTAAAPLPRMVNLPFLAVVGADGTLAHVEFVEIKSLAHLEQIVREAGVAL